MTIETITDGPYTVTYVDGIERIRVVTQTPKTARELRREEILLELARIDAATDTPRSRREALLGNVMWLQQQDAMAATLRAELAAL